MKRRLKAADLFCGAGGTSSGLVEACDELGYEVDLTAINHWEIAVATHSANHPKARHLCASLDALNPRDLYREGELDLLWASPECTHHSIARGGKPVSDQSRATAWCVVRWAEALRPDIILVENVKEFLTWGPIGTNGRPIKARKGEVFHSWVKCLEALGYRVGWRILCAADYGDPTTRQRLFVQAVRGRRKVTWPEPTHGPTTEGELFGKRQPWVAAREVIDWKLEGKSIYQRKKPLAEKTMRRILIGLEKFGLRPFVVGAGGPEYAAKPVSVEEPFKTVLTSNHSYLTQPYLVHMRGNCDAKSLDKPAPTLTSGGGHLGLCEPYLVQCNHGNGKDRNGDARRVRHLDAPLPTVAGNRGEWAMCNPFLIQTDQTGSNGACVRSADTPLSTIVTKQNVALIEPFLVKYFSSGENVRTLGEPLPAITCRDRFGLVQPTVEMHGEKYLLDIRFRMLAPHELAAAQGFPKGYKFQGNTTQVVKQIGNAVPRGLARALVRAVVSQSEA